MEYRGSKYVEGTAPKGLVWGIEESHKGQIIEVSYYYARDGHRNPKWLRIKNHSRPGWPVTYYKRVAEKS